jgi:hypothetical protein
MASRRPKEDQNRWNFYFSVFFILVLIASIWGIRELTGTFPHSIPFFDFVLLALASFRITRLIVYDKIARWFRELFADTREVERDGEVMIEVRPYGWGIRQTLYDLLQCPWCIGVWSGIITTFFYFVFPWAWYVILFLAVAGVSSFVQVCANLLGWQAENLKLEARERNRDLQL